jgi:hypothetical protein
MLSGVVHNPIATTNDTTIEDSNVLELGRSISRSKKNDE